MYQWIIDGFDWIFSFFKTPKNDEEVVVHDFTQNVTNLHALCLFSRNTYRALAVSQELIEAGDLLLVKDDFDGEEYTLKVSKATTPFGRDDLYSLVLDKGGDDE